MHIEHANEAPRHTHALKDWDLIYFLFIFTIYISCYILILQRHAKCCFTVVTEFEVRFLNNRTLWVQRQSWPCVNSHSLMAHCNCNKWPWNPQYFTLHMCPFDAGKWQTYCDNYVNVVSLQLVAGNAVGFRLNLLLTHLWWNVLWITLLIMQNFRLKQASWKTEQ